MPKWKYALEPGGDKSLEISIGTFIWQKKTKVQLNGNLIGIFPNQKELAEGRVLQLPDGTALRVQLVKTFFSFGFRVLRNDKPLPGSCPDPTIMRFNESFGIVYSIAGLNIVLGFIALFFQMQGVKYISGEPASGVEVLQMLGFGNISVAIGFIFLVLGFFTQHRSLLALIIIMIIFGLESVSVLFSGLNILFSASNMFLTGFLGILLTGFIGGLIPIFIGVLLGMGRGVVAINELKKESPPNTPVINKKSSSVLSALGLLVGLIILGVGVYYIYISQVKKVIDVPSIDERNAAASAAVAYESGADFVEALKRSGVPCTKQDIYPVTVDSSLGPIHVADSVTCTYSEDDWVNVFVAWQSEFSSTYFSMSFEAEQKAKAATGAQNLTLKGELWAANATTDQRLFDTQGALGGQLIKP